MFQHFFKLQLFSYPLLIISNLALSVGLFQKFEFKSFLAFVAKRSASTRSTFISLANLSLFSFTALISAVTIFRLSDFYVSSFSALCFASSDW